MLSAHESFKDFVTGAKSGSDERFFCRICKRDVTKCTHGVSERIRHFGSVGHWRRDVTHRVHLDMPVYNKLLEPMTLSETQFAEHRARPFEDFGGEFPYPENLVAKQAHPGSKVPLMTLVSCVWNCYLWEATSSYCDTCGGISLLHWVPESHSLP